MTGRGRIRVAVVGGGENCEHDVSLESASAACAALDRDMFDVVPLTIGRDGTWLDPTGAPMGQSRAESVAVAVRILSACDVVLPLLHGPRGEDGTLAALCDLVGVPCVGSPLGASAIAMDKWATKLMAEAVGVLTAPAKLLTRGDTVAFNGPVVVKPVAAGSSYGVTLVEREEELEPALRAAFELDERVLVEEFIVGREIDIAVIDDPEAGRRPGPPLEILNGGQIFDTATKYDGNASFVVPAQLSPGEARAISDAALRIYDALGCRGYARIDFFLTKNGPVLNEVNTIPGMTAHSQVPRMFAAEGMDYTELLTRLIRTTVR